MLLDPINLVTCLYRLAKMSFSGAARSRNVYLMELQRSSTFQLLLSKWLGQQECLLTSSALSS